MFLFKFIILFGMMSVATASVATNFLSPSVGIYNQLYGYHYHARSKNSHLEQYRNCDTHGNPRFSNSLTDLYKDCGAHNFDPDSLPKPNYYMIGLFPHNVEIYLALDENSRNDKNEKLIDCLMNRTVEVCLPVLDVDILQCLNTTTGKSISIQNCPPWFEIFGIAFGAVIGIMILFVAGVYVVEYFLKRQTYIRTNIDDGGLEFNRESIDPENGI